MLWADQVIYPQLHLYGVMIRHATRNTMMTTMIPMITWSRVI
jgi:hypothetical protein